jgi:hypothetical protein
LKKLAGALTSLFLLWPPCAAAQQDGWIGAKACGACHRTQYERQSASAHARSLYHAADHPLAGRFVTDGPLSRAPGFHFAFPVSAGNLHFHADDGKYVTDLPVEWAFGAGEHAVTFLSRVTPDVHLELAFSYYTNTGSFDLTPRHETLRAGTLHEAMGQPIQTRTAGRQCFGCHSTGLVSVSQAGEVQVTEAGVHCEGCHGPGAAHRAAALQGDILQSKRVIRNPGALSAVALNQFCGTCHRVAGNLADTDWNSPWSIRHQPPYLARSRCFQESGGRLSCLTCHDLHDAIRRADAAYYRTRCVSCHSTAHQRNADCTKCHMPAVAASSHLSFRNHQIGIYH